MSERKDKTLEQVSDEDYKVAPTSADTKYLAKKAKANGENYDLPKLDK
ncbi:MAG: hypothetical protein AB1351_06925 [Thermoproteota archaeon]